LKNISQRDPRISSETISVPKWLVTTAVGIVACGLVVAELAPATNLGGKANLSALNQRAAELRKIHDPIERDSHCIPLSAYGRMLDRAIDKDARIFLSGMVGKENAGRGGYLYFLRNYLFPRDVEISLGRPAVFFNEWRDGTDCDSPEMLRTNGFDLFLRFETNNNISIIPLTERGVPKQ
jgi:hypothetical protein